MSRNDPYLRFSTFGELLHYFEEHTGTIRRAMIPQTNSMAPKTTGEVTAIGGTGLVLELASGETAYLTSEDAEAILNEGILNRQQVEITFMG